MSKAFIYDHQNTEEGLYEFWKKNNFFDPIPKNKNHKNFSIILPPPNITGQLHLGHAWDGSLQDVIIRYKKLKGCRTIWIPGTDHAGIATQTKYEKVLKENGEVREQMSDAEFLKKLFAWSKQQANYIHQQWAKLGFALSYKDELYTLDSHVSELVNSTFKKLYDDGLIYRAFKLVNWDVSLKTAISDMEVIHRETNSKFYYFKYLIKDTKEFIPIATTRPETMFGDIAVFVNPKDKRYKKWIGAYAINPINNQPLKIFADSYIDMKFGTGAMKCTPAHDFNDYQLAKKHKITQYKSIMNEDGSLTTDARSVDNSYGGIDRLIARDAIVSELQRRELLIKTEEYKNKIGYSERSGELIEPLLSKQWFIKMQPLAKQTIAMIQKQKPNFIPQRFKKTMDTWLANVDDWCITRQLLWGHRVPVWYNKDKIIVGNVPKKSIGWTQDKDVLDTWFSSGLWPIALTTQHELEDFYPIDMLVTGYDILFFWIARMFFQCGYLTKKIPLHNVLFHGLVRDEHNRKMSKSLNNGINPMKVINDYGADALRMFLVSTATIGEDLRYSSEKIQYRWSFINKVWNASNYLNQFTKIESITLTKKSKLIPFNIWILQRFNYALKKIEHCMDKYDFIVADKYIQEFIWEDFCNKYLEFIKPPLKKELHQAEILTVARLILKNILIVLHPFTPFFTERLYLDVFHNKKSIMLESWPSILPFKRNLNYETLVNTFIDIYTFIRELRIKNGIKQTNKIEINLITTDDIELKDINGLLDYFNISIKKIGTKRINTKANVKIIGKQIIEYFDDFVDPADKLVKLNKEKIRLENEIKRSQNILSNKKFLQHAPNEKVKEEQAKFAQYQEQYQKILEHIKKIS